MLSKISLAFRYPEEMFSKRRGNLACHWTNDLKFIYLWSSQNHKTRGRIFIILDFCICIYWPFCSPILCQHCCRLFVCTTGTSVIGTPTAWMVQKKKINTFWWAVTMPVFLLYPLGKFVSTLASNIKCLRAESALNVRVKTLLVQRIAPRHFVHIRRSSRNL